MPLGAVITAAGESSRMGCFKPLLKIGGVSAAEHIVLSFRDAGVNDIVIVTGNRAEELENGIKHLNVMFIKNNMYKQTDMFASVKIGIDYLKEKCDNILVTPVDTPLFTPNTVTKLVESGARVAVPVYNGRAGHPIILNKGIINNILDYKGDKGLKGAISSLCVNHEQVEVNDSGVLYDMDTKEEYDRIIKLHSRKHKSEMT